MTYVWEFNTEGRPEGPIGRKCHRGPMISIENTLSQPFTKMVRMENLRTRLLAQLVDSPLVAVQTREAVLRVLNSNFSAMYPALLTIQTSLRVLICEKKNSIVVDTALLPFDTQWKDEISTFTRYGVIEPHTSLILEGIDSESPIYRIAARCAAAITAAYIEAAG